MRNRKTIKAAKIPTKKSVGKKIADAFIDEASDVIAEDSAKTKRSFCAILATPLRLSWELVKALHRRTAGAVKAWAWKKFCAAVMKAVSTSVKEEAKKYELCP